MDTLSEPVKKLVTNILEPDVSKRWRLDQIVHSDWIAMDPRLLVLTPAEQTAFNNATEERKRYEEKFSKKETVKATQRKSIKVEERKKSEVEETRDSEEVTVIKENPRVAISSIVAGENYFKKLGV